MMRSKAAVAIIFATSSLILASPATAADAVHVKSDSAVHHILADVTGTPYLRAFVLLKLADSYLQYRDSLTAEKYFIESPSPINHFKRGLYRDGLAIWTNQLSNQAQTAITGGSQQKFANKTLFDQAIAEALKQIDLTADQAEKIKFNYIASMLFKKAGEQKQFEKQRDLLQKSLLACETAPGVDSEGIAATCSVLNSMSYALLPVAVNYFKSSSDVKDLYSGQPFQTAIANAEGLRLRAIAIADRLPADNDTRRMVHRNMAIWYSQLGKTELADKQKQALFELVGFEDDELLYPQRGVCGRLVWWARTNEANLDERCGMG